METLRFEYDDASGDYVAEYRGLTIRAVRDDCPENPFEMWDAEPPTLVYAGRREGFSDYSGDTLSDPLAAISDAKLARRWRDVCAALNISAAEYERERAERRADYGDSAADTRRALAETALDDARHGNGTDYLETLAALWRVAGCVAETWSSHGYSQGDWAEGLSVATPDWARLTGAPRVSHSDQCKAAGRLWSAWAWGDVYGYVIDDDGDSCWGFYGSDFEESGLADAAREAADYTLSRRAKARQERAAELIKARVPLIYRPALLDAASA